MKEKTKEHRREILKEMRTQEGIIWDQLTLPNASKNPRKYDEEIRNKPEENQLYESSCTINFFFPTIASDDKIFLINSPFLSSSVSQISMCHFNPLDSSKPLYLLGLWAFLKRRRRNELPRNILEERKKKTKENRKKAVTKLGII